MTLTGLPARNLIFTLGLAIIYFVSAGVAKKRPTGRGDRALPFATGPVPQSPYSCGLRDMFSCNVERNARHNQQCRLRQDHTDDFDWTCNRGKTPSSKHFDRIINKHKYPITGPDSAKYGRNYLYASIAGNGRHKVARLIVEGSDVRGKGYFCLRFAHCHNGFHIGELRVYDRVGNGPRQTWWSLAGDFGPHWHTAAVQLNLTSVTEVGFEYQNGGPHSDMGLDEVSMKPGKCEEHKGYLYECNFETSDGSSTMCDMVQERRFDTFDWTLWHGNTPSKETGPKAAFDGEYYIYIEADNRKKGDDAIIFFPPAKTKQDVVLTFSYHMFGFHTGNLSVCILQKGNKCAKGEWERSGTQEDEWHFGEVEGTLDPNDRIGFRATCGVGHTGDIAIDNIEIKLASAQSLIYDD